MKRTRKTRFLLYSCGIFILTLGVSLTIQSDLGTSPFDALLVGLSEHVGLTVGSWEVILAVLLLCCNSLLSRQRPEISGLVTALITGVGIDMWLFFVNDWIEPATWFGKLFCFGAGLLVIGLGTSIYLHTHIAPIPVDRLTLILQALTRTNILLSRTFIYLFFLILAVLFRGPIGIGTLLTVCLGGIILNSFMPLTQKALDPLLTNGDSAANDTSIRSHPR
ncbi:YczE/YyaS/YitT family protein [Paenibacillus mucilaginosus]|uniref:YczE/YyaS/YitT family protein n=1 Tax=Paenibacillus mucilaginosus TaxID=61624 RepID=UPI0005A0A758|nr:YitT family protein [Paenibacillus mucilaginosus]MCG7214385.1 YitT family protein [Paenibacillus mucilaginosus]WDM30671.1 YitT family protein [Paenibacillus mucilaginosus]